MRLEHEDEAPPGGSGDAAVAAGGQEEDEDGDGGGNVHDERCKECNKGGELMLCDGKNCSTAMHRSCARLDRVPDGNWWFYGRYKDDSKIGPCMQVGRGRIGDMDAEKYTHAMTASTHPDFSKKWVDIGFGASSAVTVAPSAASPGPTGQATRGGDGGVVDGNVVDDFHCADASMFNLLRHDHPAMAKLLVPRLNDSSHRRMTFEEIGTFLDRDAPLLQVRKLVTDDVQAEIEQRAARHGPGKLVVAVDGNSHCIAANTERNEYADSAAGNVVAIDADGALAQLGVSSFTKAIIVEFKWQRNPGQSGKRRKGRGNKPSCAQKKARRGGV